MVSKKIIFLILIAVFFQSSLLFLSGVKTPEGIVFQPLGYHDGVWHLALISELKRNLPPNHPNFFGARLINYHYLWDLILAVLSKIFLLDQLTV